MKKLIIIGSILVGLVGCGNVDPVKQRDLECLQRGGQVISGNDYGLDRFCIEPKVAIKKDTIYISDSTKHLYDSLKRELDKELGSK